MIEQRILIFTVGISHSGKSTIVKQLQGRFNQLIRISADDFRLLVYGQVFYSEGEKYVWAVRETMLNYLLSQGKPIIIDEVNTTRERRRDIIYKALKHEYKVYCVFVGTDLDTCLSRINRKNESYVNLYVNLINAQCKKLQFPILDEGIDKIFYVNNRINETNSLIDLISYNKVKKDNDKNGLV